MGWLTGISWCGQCDHQKVMKRSSTSVTSWPGVRGRNRAKKLSFDAPDRSRAGFSDHGNLHSRPPTGPSRLLCHLTVYRVMPTPESGGQKCDQEHSACQNEPGNQ